MQAAMSYQLRGRRTDGRRHQRVVVLCAQAALRRARPGLGAGEQAQPCARNCNTASYRQAKHLQWPQARQASAPPQSSRTRWCRLRRQHSTASGAARCPGTAQLAKAYVPRAQRGIHAAACQPPGTVSDGRRDGRRARAPRVTPAADQDRYRGPRLRCAGPSALARTRARQPGPRPATAWPESAQARKRSWLPAPTAGDVVKLASGAMTLVVASPAAGGRARVSGRAAAQRDAARARCRGVGARADVAASVMQKRMGARERLCKLPLL